MNEQEKLTDLEKSLLEDYKALNKGLDDFQKKYNKHGCYLHYLDSDIVNHRTFVELWFPTAVRSREYFPNIIDNDGFGGFKPEYQNLCLQPKFHP